MHLRHSWLASSVALMGLTGASGAWAQDVAQGAQVTIASGASTLYNSPSAPLSDITDGTFLPEGTAYHSTLAASAATEWLGAMSGGAPATGLVLDINLGGNFSLTGAAVQADDNDAYLLQYLNESTNTWQTLYAVPAVSVGAGLVTRTTTFAPVVTDELQFSAVQGDGGYAVSQIEAYGTAVVSPPTAAPEIDPNSAASGIALLVGGLLIFTGRRRLVRQKA